MDKLCAVLSEPLGDANQGRATRPWPVIGHASGRRGGGTTPHFFLFDPNFVYFLSQLWALDT